MSSAWLKTWLFSNHSMGERFSTVPTLNWHRNKYRFSCEPKAILHIIGQAIINSATNGNRKQFRVVSMMRWWCLITGGFAYSFDQIAITCHFKRLVCQWQGNACRPVPTSYAKWTIVNQRNSSFNLLLQGVLEWKLSDRWWVALNAELRAW